jgi:hypothetical protein
LLSLVDKALARRIEGRKTIGTYVQIRILGSVKKITDPDTDPALIVSGFNMPIKKRFFSRYFFLIYISVFKDNKSIISQKTVEIKVFLFSFLLFNGMIRIRSWIYTYNYGSGSCRPKKLTDPEHCAAPTKSADIGS